MLQLLRQKIHLLRRILITLLQGSLKTRLIIRQLVQQLRAVWAHQFRRPRGRRRAHVRHKIRQRKIRFMPHSAHNRQAAIRNRPRHHLLVKRPQILQASPATAHNQHIHFRALIRRANRLRNLLLAARPLHRRGIQHQRNMRRTTAQRRNHIAQRSRRQTRYHTDALRVFRQSLFTLGRKQTLRIQLLFQPFITLKKLPHPHLPHLVHIDLELATRRINANLAAHFNVFALAQRLRQTRRRKFKQNATHLRQIVFQQKIIMPARRPR